ncbi:MAG TPA: type II toxin-antitoxin system VapC family toxin [Thermoanaerobaculia bacterium]|nr:type II toxin-antitoxin system VapC family toxin [Thermoanaerobaculia bacterium]
MLDTHVFLWYVGGDPRVGSQIRAAIEDADLVYLSVVSIWEATIKYQLGKLHLPEPPHPWLSVQREQHGIESLPVDEATVAHLSELEPHHRVRSHVFEMQDRGLPFLCDCFEQLGSGLDCFARSHLSALEGWV